jgi:glyoxylase-like metal-dependent hydrolase (beta-lactamase superfamily II)
MHHRSDEVIEDAMIAERFGKPVRYLIYSHDHADHISGGEVFSDTATIVTTTTPSGRSSARIGRPPCPR